MKKFIVAAACVLMAASASAQGFSYGVKAGLNVANITADDVKAKVGFYAGLVGEYAFNDFIGLQAELLYSAQGGKLDGDGDIKQKLDYLNIPVLAKLYLIDGLSLEIGPQFGFLLSSKLKGSDDGVDVSIDNKDAMKTFDMSVPMGLSYRFGMGLEVNARYVLGLTDIADNGDGKNGVFQVGLGYRF